MLIASALAILLTWAVTALVLIGLGSLLLSRIREDASLPQSFWMGLALSVGLLEIWILFLPVNGAIVLLLCVLAALGLMESRAALLGWLKVVLQEARWAISLYAAIALFLAVRAAGPNDYFDTGLYGAQAVRWLQTYPTIPGLANLHGRFGFNSSAFLCIAALNRGPWSGLAFHLFTGFLLMPIVFLVLNASLRVARGEATTPAVWFHCILAIPVGFWTIRIAIVGTQSDEPATIVSLVAAGMIFQALCRKDEEPGSRLHSGKLLVAASLLCLAVTFKQTTAVFALIAWAVAFAAIWTRGVSEGAKKRTALAVLAMSCFLLVPWLARGILLSGYPFFPVSALGVAADWKVPSAMAHWYLDGAQAYARMPDVEHFDMRNYAWFYPWLRLAIRDRAGFQVPALISLFGVVLAFLRRRSLRGGFAWLWLLAPSLLGTIAWFFAAPAMRFGQFAIWTGAAVLGALGIAALRSHINVYRLDKGVLGAVVLLLLWCLVSFGSQIPYHKLVSAPPLSPLPEVSVVERKTAAGLTVYLPSQGSQCWDAPLPCTPYSDETLRLRRPNSLRAGFHSDAQATFLPKFLVHLDSSGTAQANRISWLAMARPTLAPQTDEVTGNCFSVTLR